MQTTDHRALVVAAVFAVGIALYSGGAGPAQALANNRWPTEDSVYGVDGWVADEPNLAQAHGVSYIGRTYRRPDGQAAVLTVATSASAKAIYRAGAEVPFLGSGYAVDAPPPDSIPSAPGRSALLVRHGNQAGAVLYAYGERRGPLGNGPLAWALVGVDAVLGHSNNYYLASMLVPYDSGSMTVRPDFVELADVVLPRLAAWYGAV
jgi:hypothetical protein